MYFICYARHCRSFSYSSFLMRTSWHCGCIYALCFLFRFRVRLLAFSFLLPSPFCHHNNETGSAAIALRTINLRKCTQRFVNKVLIAFLSGTDDWAQATLLIAFLSNKLHSWSVTPTPPTENTHCKIIILALRCSSTILYFLAVKYLLFVY